MKSVGPLGGRTLAGRFVALEPLAPLHHADLIAAAADPGLWTYIPVDPREGFAGKLSWLSGEMRSGRQLVYAVRRLADQRIVGATSYLAIVPEHARVEIGWTWYAADAQATQVNPEAKYLLLSHAFAAGYNRVEFKTDVRNARSRAALAKLGAKEDGVLRSHMWMPKGYSRQEGYFRDSVYFSILAEEWPAVKAGLELRLGS